MDVDLSKVSARESLELRREPHWMRLGTGNSLGFRRMTSTSEGTWIARYWDPVQSKKPMKSLGEFRDLPKNQRFSAAKQEAEKWFQHLGRGGQAGIYMVADACKDYVKHVLSTKGSKAAGDASTRFKNYVLDDLAFAKIELSKLTPQIIEKWLDRVRLRPNTAGANRGELRSASTLNRDVTPFRAALNYAIAQGYVSTDFAWKSKLKPIKNADTKRQLYLDKKQRKLLIDKSSSDLKLFVEGLCKLPFRPGALASLIVQDFDPRLNVIQIADDKGKEFRQLHLTDSVAALFLRATKDQTPSTPVFRRDNGKAWNKDSWKVAIKDAVDASGLPSETTAYTLRHSTITDLVHAGVDLLTVAQISGTSVRMIEKHYGHLRSNVAKSALKVLDF